MKDIEPLIESSLGRFRIPAEDAQEILDEIMLAMIAKRNRIRDPERWLVRMIKVRCLRYWRTRRQRLYRIADAGVLALLDSSKTPEEEKKALRRELATLLEGLSPRCREVLGRRYGLPRAGPEGASETPPEEDAEVVLACLEAISRRVLRQRPVAGFPVLRLIEGEGKSPLDPPFD